MSNRQSTLSSQQLDKDSLEAYANGPVKNKVARNALYIAFSWTDKIHSLFLPILPFFDAEVKSANKDINALRYHYVREKLEKAVDGKEFHLKLLQTKLAQLPTQSTSLKVSNRTSQQTKKVNKAAVSKYDKELNLLKPMLENKDISDDALARLPVTQETYFTETQRLYQRYQQLDILTHDLTILYRQQYALSQGRTSAKNIIKTSAALTSHWDSGLNKAKPGTNNSADGSNLPPENLASPSAA